MTEQMPSFLNPQSNGTESIRYDRLYYKVQPKPHFAIKKSDSDMTEEVNFKQLALDLSNMNIGYVKWLGTTPTKIMQSALDSMPPKPQGDGWNTVYELKVYSVNNMENIMELSEIINQKVYNLFITNLFGMNWVDLKS